MGIDGRFVSHHRKTAGGYEEQLLSAHDLQEVRVIMSHHIPSERDEAMRQELGRQFYGDY